MKCEDNAKEEAAKFSLSTTGKEHLKKLSAKNLSDCQENVKAGIDRLKSLSDRIKKRIESVEEEKKSILVPQTCHLEKLNFPWIYVGH
jgi:hypothetical protein